MAVVTTRKRRGKRLWLIPLLMAGVLATVLFGPRAADVAKDAVVDWRTDQYDLLIRQAANKEGLSHELVRAVVEVESGGRPDAVSEAGAVGLMQVMPIAEKDVRQRRGDIPSGDLRSPEHNLRVGTAYLRYLKDRFDGDVTLVLAAYHMGPTAVAKLRRDHPALSSEKLVEQHAGPKTRAYVRNVKRAMAAEHG